jgi:hypothetical protein
MALTSIAPASRDAEFGPINEPMTAFAQTKSLLKDLVHEVRIRYHAGADEWHLSVWSGTQCVGTIITEDSIRASIEPWSIWATHVDLLVRRLARMALGVGVGK